jgi:hypothetical protein
VVVFIPSTHFNGLMDAFYRAVPTKCNVVAARQMAEMMAKMITCGPLPEGERARKILPRLIVRESA